MDGDVILPTDLENTCGNALRSRCLEAARIARPQLAAVCVLHSGSLGTPGSGSDVTRSGSQTPQRGVDGRDRVPCKPCSRLGWNMPSPRWIMRPWGLQYDMTFAGMFKSLIGFRLIFEGRTNKKD